MMKRITIAACVLLLSACATKLIEPTEADISRVKTKYPEYTVEQLQKGKSLYVQHCGNCHGLYKPSSQSEAEWTKIVPWMSNKVNKQQPNTLSTNDQELILKYVITMGPLRK
jgi:mono/diheme cytochrome c family protein